MPYDYRQQAPAQGQLRQQRAQFQDPLVQVANYLGQPEGRRRQLGHQAPYPSHGHAYGPYDVPPQRAQQAPQAPPPRTFRHEFKVKIEFFHGEYDPAIFLEWL